MNLLAKLLPIKNLVLFVGVVILIYTAFSIGSWGKESTELRYRNSIQEWTRERAAIIKMNDSLDREVRKMEEDRLKDAKVVETQTKEITRLSNVARTRKVELDAKAESLLATRTDTICDEYVGVIKGYQSVIDTMAAAAIVAERKDEFQERQIVSLLDQKNLLTQSNDSLRKLVIKVPIYKPSKFLGFIPMPSRKLAFVGGIVVGATAGVVLLK